MTIINLHYPVMGSALLADHGYALYGALARVVPEIHYKDTRIQIGPIKARYGGQGQLRLGEQGGWLRLRLPAEQIGLVAVAEEEVGANAAELLDDLAGGGEQARRVVGQPDRLDALLAGGAEKGAAAAALGEGQEDGPDVGRKVAGQPEHLPLGAADKGGGGEVDHDHDGLPELASSRGAPRATQPSHTRSSLSARTSQS